MVSSGWYTSGGEYSNDVVVHSRKATSSVHEMKGRAVAGDDQLMRCMSPGLKPAVKTSVAAL